MVDEYEREQQALHNQRMREREKLARLRTAFDALSKALCLPDGPSLTVQRHDPSWGAWKDLCNAFADNEQIAIKDER
jgi:hypothetical protein